MIFIINSLSVSDFPFHGDAQRGLCSRTYNGHVAFSILTKHSLLVILEQRTPQCHCRMLTRRDKLLNRPWQLRRFNNHRLKVLNAVPAIDFGPPIERKHVTCKLKKLQWEGERRQRIEEENLKLLQRMGSIMKKNRLENSWRTPPPDFLHRVGIYHRTRSPTPFRELEGVIESETGSLGKRRCSACTPSTALKPQPMVPEERVPWAPPRTRLSRKPSCSAEVKPLSDFEISKSRSHRRNAQSAVDPPPQPILAVTDKKARSKSVPAKKHLDDENAAENRLILRQGNLKLCVNFPPFAEVQIVSGNDKASMQRRFCQCQSISQAVASGSEQKEEIL